MAAEYCSSNNDLEGVLEDHNGQDLRVSVGGGQLSAAVVFRTASGRAAGLVEC
jgi:hypothetical protein